MHIRSLPGASTIKRLVSKKKLRFTKDGFDLDLSYITPRLIAMGYPSTGAESYFRNPAPQVQRLPCRPCRKHSPAPRTSPPPPPASPPATALAAAALVAAASGALAHATPALAAATGASLHRALPLRYLSLSMHIYIRAACDGMRGQ